MARLIHLVTVVLLAGLPAVFVPSPAGAAPPTSLEARACPPEGCPGPTFRHTATLTVAQPSRGAVTSDTYAAHAIDCPVTCTVSDTQVTDDPVWPVDGWHTYTLTAAGGGSGFAPVWTGCDSLSGSQCRVSNGADGPASSVSLGWQDVQNPTVALGSPQLVGSYAPVSATASDNAGIARVEFRVNGVIRAVDTTAPYTATLPMGADGTHAVSAWAVDTSNRVTFVTRSVVADRTSPELAWTSGPAEGKSVAGSATSFAFSLDEPHPGTVRCTLDGTVLPGCAPGGPVELTGLTEADHELRIIAVDQVGNSATITRHFTRTRVPFPSTAPSASTTYGKAATLTVPGLRGWTGEVTFRRGRTELCRVDVRDGVASCRAPANLVPGSYTVAATYAGDDAHAPGAAGLRLVIAKAATHLRAAPAHRSVRAGRALRLTARGLPGAASGRVSFTRKGKVLCSAPVRAGRATCATARSLKPGRYRVRAAYSGSARYRGSATHLRFRVTRPRH